MAKYYDFKHRAHHQYQMFECVGVTVPPVNPRKGSGSKRDCIPGLVIGVHPRYADGSTSKVTHMMYTVWCEFGVLLGQWKIDKLCTLPANNYPALPAILDSLTPAERLSVNDANFVEPLQCTAKDVARISLDDAYNKLQSRRTHRVEDQSRKRTAPARTAANAADAAVAATRADTRKAASLAVVTNRPVVRTVLSQASRVTCILEESRTKYKVRWSEPEGNPEVTWELKSWLLRHPQYISVVGEYVERQGKEQQQQQHEEDGGVTASENNKTHFFCCICVTP